MSPSDGADSGSCHELCRCIRRSVTPPACGCLVRLRRLEKMLNLCNFGDTSRLSIEMNPEQHRQIKTLATFEGMSIKEFILSRTLSREKSSEEADTTGILLTHPKNRQRLLSAIKTPQKDHVIFETMDKLKDALGI